MRISPRTTAGQHLLSHFLPVNVIMLCQTLALFFFSVPLSSATSLVVQIPPSNILPNPRTLPASMHATLTSGTSPQLHAPLTRRNTLEFHNLTQPGDYLLDIYSTHYVFAPFRVDITEGQPLIEGVWETYRGTRWEDKGVLLGGLSASATSDRTRPEAAAGDDEQIVTVNAKVLSRRAFYEQREGFSPLSLLKNPMILLAIVALAIAFGMPKMMENMDPETRAEFEEQQKRGPLAGMTRAMQGQGPASSAAGGFDLAGWMAGAQQGRESSGSDVRGGGGDVRRRG